jgi:hypothetical protein
MYKTLFFLMLLLASAHIISAQVYPSGGQGGCAIKYEYDAAGNRVKRSKYCWSSNGGGSLRPSAIASEVSTLDMLVYPNPATTYITVDFNQDVLNAKVELQDMTGKVLASKIPNDRSVQFDMQSLAQGAYLVVLKRKDTKETLVRKVVKE